MKKIEFSEESNLMCCTMNFHEGGHVSNTSKYSFLICFLMVSVYFPCGWKSAGAVHPMGDACPERLQPKGMFRGRAVVPVGVLWVIPLIRGPSDQVQPTGGLYIRTNICAWHGPKEEERSGSCGVNMWQESQGDEGCAGVAWTESPLLNVWHW